MRLQDLVERGSSLYDKHFAHGYDDFRAGVDREDNPHDGGVEREAWFDGWDARAREKAD